MSDDLNAAIAAAASEANTEVTGGNADVRPEPEPAKETPAAAETPADPKPAAEEKAAGKPEDDEDPFKLTAADLELINKSPELQKAYRSMRKGFTAKTTELANERKNLSERAKVADWIQSDPDAAVETLARMRGKTLSAAKQEATDKVADGLAAKYEQTMGKQAADLLRPLFEETAREIMQSMVTPIQQQTEALQRAAYERGIAAGVAEFGASRTEAGEEWTEEIQAEMASVIDRTKPDDNASMQDYLGDVYDAVMAKRFRKGRVKEQLSRLRDAQRTESTSSARPAPRTEERITEDMSDRDAIALAVKQAQAAMR